MKKSQRLSQLNSFIKTEDEDFAEANELFDDVELSEEYISMWKDINQSLSEQWSSLIYSWFVFLMYDKFSQFFVEWKKLTTEQENKIKKTMENKLDDYFSSVKGYNKFWIKLKSYLLFASNKAWNYELNQFLGNKNKYIFKLVNSYYRRKIEDRIESLVTWLDNYTKIKFAQELFKEIKSNTPKTDILKSLNATGESLIKIREQNILKSETVAQIEYMRYISAKMNWVWYKTWMATLDERTCRICRPLNQETVKIDWLFTWWFELPPVHPTCRCFIRYDYETSFASRFSKKNYEFYPSWVEEWTILFWLVNPEYVWTWGNEYQWDDKKLIDYYKKLVIYNIKDIKEVSENLDKDYIWLYQIKEVLIEARDNLTQNGYIQLLYKLLNNKPWRNSKVTI